MSEITIILPECSDDYVSESLRELTKRVCLATGDDGSGALGGEYGYGSNFENDTFMLHRFCWCEREDCPWCMGCTCPDGIGGDMSLRCDLCLGNVKPAPNFLHKATGASVTWYKYIGRSMEVDKADWPTIFKDCMDSLARDN